MARYFQHCRYHVRMQTGIIIWEFWTKHSPSVESWCMKAYQIAGRQWASTHHSRTSAGCFEIWRVPTFCGVFLYLCSSLVSLPYSIKSVNCSVNEKERNSLGCFHLDQTEVKCLHGLFKEWDFIIMYKWSNWRMAVSKMKCRWYQPE